MPLIGKSTQKRCGDQYLPLKSLESLHSSRAKAYSIFAGERFELLIIAQHMQAA